MKNLLPVFFATLFILSSCAPTEVKGGKFNDVFPKDEGDFDVVFVSEKVGYTQATLKQKGTDVATLTITDEFQDAVSKAKYAESPDKIGGYPAVPRGDQGTAILVADRFQVQVRSQVDTFNADARKAWIEKFDLKKLSTLK